MTIQQLPNTGEAPNWKLRIVAIAAAVLTVGSFVRALRRRSIP